MEFDYLDTESENLLKELLDYDKRGQEVPGAAMEYLVKSGYVEGFNSRTCEDKEPKYIGRNHAEGKNLFRKKNEI